MDFRKVKKENQKGFSLVELIVAIAILAIIVLPLLRAFVVSARTNAKSKEKLRTTELAQNIMEGITASDLESIAYQFNYPGTDNADFTFLTGQDDLEVQEMVLNSNGDYEAATRADSVVIPDYITNPEDVLAGLNVTSSIVKFSGETDYTFVGQSGGTYYFAMKNLLAGGDSTDSSARYYDALVTLTANTDDSSGGSGKLNEQEIVNINDIDEDYDALCIADSTPESVMAQIQNQYPDVEQADVSRTITISIEEVSTSSDTYTRVTVSYQYEWETDGVGYVFPASSLDGNFSDVVFDNSEDTDRELSSVYLFFYPWYTSTQANLTDTIVIDNSADLDVTAYLVKQETTATSLETLENAYRVNVDIEEPVDVSDTAVNTAVRTNLNTNLSTESATTGEQALWAVNGVNAGAADLISQDTLSAKAASDRLFDVTVAVYESGSYDVDFKDAEELVSLTGGMVN